VGKTQGGGVGDRGRNSKGNSGQKMRKRLMGGGYAQTGGGIKRKEFRYRTWGEERKTKEYGTQVPISKNLGKKEKDEGNLGEKFRQGNLG